MTTEASAIIACIILAGLSIFQILLAAGLPLGRYAWGGAHKILPKKLRIGSAISILTYLFFAVIILEKSGLINMLANDAVSDTGIYIIAAYLILGVALNAISRSTPERIVMTPIALILAVLFLFVAIA